MHNTSYTTPKQLTTDPQTSHAGGWFILIILVGSIIRLAIAQRGYNFDIASYRIVADILVKDGNVYVETQRYNYGPIWFYILSFLDYLPFPVADPLLSLRWKVSSFLTLTDIGIATCLFRWYGVKVACLFFLNPVSIIITGYHSQFDNLAILVGLISLKTMEKDAANTFTLKSFAGLLLLGLSLSIKHVLFLFPLWLAFKMTRWRDKLFTIIIPYTLFLAAFLPFLPEGGKGILNHVFFYRGFSNAPFWMGSAPTVIVDKVPIFILFIGTLTLFGLFSRSKKPLESLFIYSISLVVFSSAVANQYLAICIVAISVHWNLMYAVYSIAGSLYLLASGDGMHIKFLQHYLGNNGNTSVIGYKELIFLLFMGLLQQLLSKDKKQYLSGQCVKYFNHIKNELILQIKSPW